MRPRPWTKEEIKEHIKKMTYYEYDSEAIEAFSNCPLIYPITKSDLIKLIPITKLNYAESEGINMRPRTKEEQKAYLDGYEMCAKCVEGYLTDEDKQKLKWLVLAVRNVVEDEQGKARAEE